MGQHLEQTARASYGSGIKPRPGVGKWLRLLWLAQLCNACKAPAEAPNPQPRPASAPASVTAPKPPEAPAADDTSYRMPGAERIVAIGDLHGDLAATRAAFQLAAAIDAQDQWIGGKLVVVQTGDQLDRGDDEPQILDLLDKWRAAAKAAGGAVYVLNGNHEVMNVQGDFRYVTSDGFRDFEPANAGKSANAAPSPAGRTRAFAPAGALATRLAQRPVVLVVGDSVFVHGGLAEAHVRYGLGRINHETQAWMLGKSAAPPAILNGDSAPIWSREYSDGIPLGDRCRTLSSVLDKLGVKRLVVGHTVQKDGISSACGGKVWRIDVGLSKYYGGKPSVLEITAKDVRPLL